MIKDKKRLAFILALILLFSGVFCTAEEEPASILGAPVIDENTETEDRFVNILLLGIDYGFPGYWGSNWKRDGIEECHADAFMIVSINMTTSEVNLISIPRDTVTYVPGVRGLYKLNATVNCGDTFEDGLEYAKAAASWLLGGVKVDYFVCVDMSAMIALGDFIGGVDIDVEMSYTGHSGKHYQKGFQHLDGRGMTDYARARRNATVNYNDLGRTSRQRQVVTAIMKKLRANPNLIKKAWNYATGGELNFYTDMKLGTVLNLANKVSGTDSIGSYVLTGPYTRVMDWNFTVTDQENRKTVLKTVFGIDAETIPFVDQKYLDWLEANGLDVVHSLNLAEDILRFGRSKPGLTAEDAAVLNELETWIQKTRSLFFAAGSSLEPFTSHSDLYTAWKELCAYGEKAAAVTGYSAHRISWHYTKRWNDDPLLNEYQLNWG